MRSSQDDEKHKMCVWSNQSWLAREVDHQERQRQFDDQKMYDTMSVFPTKNLSNH